MVMGSMDRPIPQVECAELRTQLYLARELEYLNKTDADEFIEKTRKNICNAL